MEKNSDKFTWNEARMYKATLNVFLVVGQSDCSFKNV
jgi:hypothetical protein